MSDREPTDGSAFPTTQWSLIIAAGASGSPVAAEALESLCRSYWYPLYAFLRRRGHDRQDAEDLVQGFFARFLQRNYLADLDREKGRFRSYLLGALKHFLANERERSRTAKRGGGARFVPLEVDLAGGETRYRAEVADSETPEDVFERRWAATVLSNARSRLRAEYAAAERLAWFDQLESFLPGGGVQIPYRTAAARLDLSLDALKSAVYRLRQRFRQLVHAEVAMTVTDPDGVDAEIRYLLSRLGQRLPPTAWLRQPDSWTRMRRLRSDSRQASEGRSGDPTD